MFRCGVRNLGKWDYSSQLFNTVMSFKPTANGGRVVHGVTPWGKFRVQWDLTGRLVSEYLEFSEPDIDAPPPNKSGGCCDPPDPSKKR